MKKILLFVSFVGLLAGGLFPESVYAESTIIQYEKDGRVKPIDEAGLLTESQLDKVLEAIGMDNNITNRIDKEEKIKIASEGGKIITARPSAIKTYYRSLNGEKIEYTDANEEKINQQKEDDLNQYNKLTGENLKIEDLERFYPEQNDIQHFATLPNNGFASVYNGKLNLNLQIQYLGSNSTQYRYNYMAHAIWDGKPFNTKTDILGLAWSEDAVASANTFSGYWYQEQLVVDGQGGLTFISEDKNLNMQDTKAYGHYVEFILGEAQYQFINTSREVRVAKRKAGDPAYVLGKYFHTYYSLSGGFSASIGPVSIDIPDKWLGAGDETIVEYSFTYGDVNTWS